MIRKAIELAIDAIKLNVQWHKDYDELSGYEESDLAIANTTSLEALEATKHQLAVRRIPCGWVVKWPTTKGIEPIYRQYAVKPTFGKEIDGLVAVQPVFKDSEAEPYQALTDADLAYLWRDLNTGGKNLDLQEFKLLAKAIEAEIIDKNGGRL